MDDNELENEREKRQHEIDMRPTSLWDVIMEHPWMTGIIIVTLLCAISDMVTHGHALERLW